MTTRNAFTAPGLGVLLLLAVAACTDSPSLPAPSVAGMPVAPTLDCVADVALLSVDCAPSAGPRQAFAAAASRLVGNQDVNVRLANSGNAFDAGTSIFSTRVTVQNLTRQALGTSDGSTATGVRVFFFDGPHAVGGMGEVTVFNPTGYAYITAANQPYYEYQEILQPYEISPALTWQFELPPGVSRFTFQVYVQADQPDESLAFAGNQWTGAANRTWSDALNWSEGVPDSASTAAVPSASLLAGDSMPLLTADARLTHLRVGTGSTLDLAGYTLTLFGNVDVPGSITGGSLWMRGAGVLLKGGVPSVTVTGSASLQGAVTASGAVSVAGGSLAVKDQPLNIAIP